MTALVLPPHLRGELERHAQRGAPAEVCGLLLGAPGRVERVVPARNRCAGRRSDRYELHPEDHLAAELEARAAGLEVLGVYHSHPQDPATPSQADQQGAHPGSLLPCFYGLYRLRRGRRVSHVFVSENFFASDAELCARYDLKGSTVRRTASRQERLKGVAAVLKARARSAQRRPADAC